METTRLIDAIVRQTTGLVAQLSTTSGLRAPLAHVVNQVFLDLVTALEGQGVGRKVVADMFGLALRSYQQKVQRLQESAAERNASLWEAVLAYLQQHETTSRAEVLAHFSSEDGATVRGVLSDLVGSALVYKTGGGDATVYRSAPSSGLGGLDGAGRAALFEHFRAVVAALSRKLTRSYQPVASSADEGTCTLVFDVSPEHPLYDQVRGLFAQTQHELDRLRAAVACHRPCELQQGQRVTFYFGQNVDLIP